MTGQVDRGRSQRAARRAWIVIGIVLVEAIILDALGLATPDAAA